MTYIYIKTAKDLATSIVKKGYRIIYGGGSVGLMGILGDAAVENNGHITGVITEQLNAVEVGHKGLTELIIVKSMHERKLEMAKRSEAVICLTGGVGTWEEFFESLTWNQLGIQSKPIILLNIDGYYDPLKTFIKHAVSEGFLPQSTSDELIFSESIDEALNIIDDFVPKDKSKWFERLKK